MGVSLCRPVPDTLREVRGMGFFVPSRPTSPGTGLPIRSLTESELHPGLENI